MKRTIKIGLLSGLVIWAASAGAEPTVSERWNKSLLAEADGDYVSALELHEDLLPKVGNEYNAHLRAGWLYYMNEDYDAAIQFYERAAGRASGALSPLYGMLNCYIAKEDASRTVRVAKAILVINDLDYIANNRLASIYYTEKKFSLAAAYYRKLNRLFPEDLAVASGLAWSYLEEGEARHAAPLFKQILLVSPDYAYAARGLSICERISNR
jgi:tetratricopeptide (TPR) repeat protein